jgi:hypothetical protein
VAATWDQKRFPPSPNLVVLETTSVPPPGTWLQLTLDERMPSAEGPAPPPWPQSSVAELPPVFLVMGPNCRNACDPSDYNAIRFSEQVDAARFAAAMSARDITDPAREQAIRPTTSVPAAGRDTSTDHGLEDAGFDRQPPARTWLLGLSASLQAFDGQTLGYPWVGIVENWHERAFTSFGDGHGVWEKDGGAQLPFYARYFESVTQHAVSLAQGDLMPRIFELEKSGFRAMPPGAGTLRRLNVRPDEIQSHGFDLTFPLYFDRRFAAAGYFGVDFALKRRQLSWMAFLHLVPFMGYGRPTILVLKVLNAVVSFLANLSPNFCSRVWCYWVGGFEQITFEFEAIKESR